YNYPEIVIFSLNFQKVIDYELSQDRVKYIKYLMKGISSLQDAGARFIIMAANSPHAVYDDLIKLVKVPILSIVHATAERAKLEGMKKLLLLGIKFTMQSTFYPDYCDEIGIEVIIPSEKEQNIIDKIIFDELVIGSFKQESKQEILNIISRYDAEGVILGCTELPLILSQKDTKLKLLDTVDLHVESALKYYLSLE
ncbi:MAG: aspartate/glutamate racemase family protein, partial [Promethearchaeota archaeon]